MWMIKIANMARGPRRGRSGGDSKGAGAEGRGKQQRLSSSSDDGASSDKEGNKKNNKKKVY